MFPYGSNLLLWFIVEELMWSRTNFMFRFDLVFNSGSNVADIFILYVCFISNNVKNN